MTLVTKNMDFWNFGLWTLKMAHSVTNWPKDRNYFFRFWCRVKPVWLLLQVIINSTFDCPIKIILQFIFSYDSLTIYDGNSNASTSLGVYCGDSIPASHISSSNEMLIHFHTDNSVGKSGFRIEYNPKSKLNFFCWNMKPLDLHSN